MAEQLFGHTSHSDLQNEYKKDGKILYKDGKEETIKYGISVIKEKAYYGNEDIANVILPGSVVEIGKGAFCGCGSLASITIPESVIKIGENPFLLCNAKLEISPKNNSFKVIDGNLYSGDGKRLISYIPKEGETQFSIPNGVTFIDNSAFYGCSRLQYVDIPSSVTAIGDSAFYGCTGLIDICIPSSVTAIGSYALYACSQLRKIIIPEGVKFIGNAAFAQCDKLIRTIIPDGVTSIEDNTFSGCRNLFNIDIPSSVNAIGNGAFNGCKNLTSVYYMGSQDEWDKIFIHKNNGKLAKVPVHTLKVIANNEIPLVKSEEFKCESAFKKYRFKAKKDEYTFMYRDGRYMGMPFINGGNIYSFSRDPRKRPFLSDRKYFRCSKFVCIPKNFAFKLDWEDTFQILVQNTEAYLDVNGTLYIGLDRDDPARSADKFYIRLCQCNIYDGFYPKDLAGQCAEEITKSFGDALVKYKILDKITNNGVFGLQPKDIAEISDILYAVFEELFNKYGLAINKKLTDESILKNISIRKK